MTMINASLPLQSLLNNSDTAPLQSVSYNPTDAPYNPRPLMTSDYKELSLKVDNSVDMSKRDTIVLHQLPRKRAPVNANCHYQIGAIREDANMQSHYNL